MYSSTLTSKGQATIPSAIRKRIGVHNGDKVAFIIEGDTVKLCKADISDALYLAAMQNTLNEEWLSDEDSKAYDDL
jgi:antitoxin PrlF